MQGRGESKLTIEQVVAEMLITDESLTLDGLRFKEFTQPGRVRRHRQQDKEERNSRYQRSLQQANQPRLSVKGETEGTFTVIIEPTLKSF